MIRLQVVEFVDTKQFLHIPTHKWWDKPRWWLVKKLGGNDPNEVVKVKRIVFDSKDFMAKLYHQERELFKYFNLEPQTLIIGASDFEEIMNCPGIDRILRFDASYMHGRQEIHGLKIVVVPWMKGMVVMP